MEENFAVGFTPDKTDGQATAQFPASCLVADATFQPRADDVQLRFTHGALETEQQTIVEQRRMINTVAVTDKSIGEAAEFQQTIPVGIVPGQPRDFQTEDDSYLAEGHFAGHASKSGTLGGAAARQTEVFIDDDDLRVGPAQLTGSLGQGVLAGRGFSVVLHLRGRGLANIDEGGSLGMGRFDFGGISHGSAPGYHWLGRLWS